MLQEKKQVLKQRWRQMPDLANESTPTLAPCIYRYRYGHRYGR